MINAYIIGEKSTIDILKIHIEKHPLTELQGYSLESSKDLHTILFLKPKIIFVDTSVIRNYKAMLLRIGQECSIIYIANCSSDAFDAFELLAFDYLLKPLSFERFEKSINKFIQLSLLAALPQDAITRRLDPITDSFFIKADLKGLKEVLVKCHEVLFIEADQNYVFIHMIDQRKYICHHTMKEMEESLPLAYFIRVHKSFIINYNQVTSIEGNVIVLNDNEKQKILIGNTYRKAFFDRKNQKVIKKHKTHFFLADYYSSTASLLLFIASTCFSNGYHLFAQGMQHILII